jgi:hypothetical protein
VTYSATVEEYDEYYNGDIIALKISTTNPNGAKLNVNSLGALDIYDEYTEEVIAANSLTADTVYTFKIKSKYINNTSVFRAYLLGHYQPHAIDVLSNGVVSDQTWTDQEGNEHHLYSKSYFKAKYSCDCVNITVVPNSPFVVQKLGEIIDVKKGGEYDNITSDALAVNRAIWENWKNCRLTDSITVTTKIAPFADVNVKVDYRPNAQEYDAQYLVTSVSHDWTGGTTSWTLTRFYPLYNEEENAGTYETLSKYTHGYLSSFTHDQMTELL